MRSYRIKSTLDIDIDIGGNLQELGAAVNCDSIFEHNLVCVLAGLGAAGVEGGRDFVLCLVVLRALTGAVGSGWGPTEGDHVRARGVDAGVHRHVHARRRTRDRNALQTRQARGAIVLLRFLKLKYYLEMYLKKMV